MSNEQSNHTVRKEIIRKENLGNLWRAVNYDETFSHEYAWIQRTLRRDS